MTPIRKLVLMLETTRRRQESIDRTAPWVGPSENEWASASRIWSRQQDALSCAIVAEPPQTLDDVLAVLIALAGRQDAVMAQGEEANPREVSDLQEMVGVAVKNCALRLAALFRTEEEPTELQHQALIWFGKQAEQWLPNQEGC